MSRRRGVLTLVSAVLVFAAFVSVHVPPPAAAPAGEALDVDTYHAVIDRVRAGESYYPVLGDELRRRGYFTSSIFDWRTPLLFCAVARAGVLVCRGVIVVLGLFLVVLTFRITVREPPWVVLTSIMQTGAAMVVFAASIEVLGEAWAGVTIGLSVCLFIRRRPGAAIGCGLVALFMRELAAPYCAACAVAALVQRRWREVYMWLGGACLYGAYYAWHVVQVRAHQLPRDAPHPDHWLNMRGLTSLLEKAPWHALLMPAPPWATALVLTLVAVGITAARAPFHARLAAGVYVGFFMLAGLTYNGYWGLVAWPAWAMVSGFGLQSLVDAGRSVVRMPGRH